MSRSTEVRFAPWQELRLQCPVRCTDGPAGVLSHIRLYPCCGTLAQLVIRRSLFANPRRVVVPITCVDDITTEQISLRLQCAALDTFPADSSRLLRALGADWRTAEPAPAAAQAAVGRDGVCSSHTAVAILSTGMAVECEDGRAGRLDMALLDPHTLRVLQLVVRHGLFVRRATTVPLGWVESITPQRIRLEAKRSRLAELPPFYGDDEIAEDVRYWLRIGPAFRRTAEWAAIGIAAHNGVVLLHGNVRSSAHKQEAEHIAQQSLCVRHVCNELISDNELAQRIERALHTSTRLRAPKVAFSVELGLVELAGEVDCPEQATLALELVQKVHGVRRIDNLLRIAAPGERVSPADVRDSVVVQRRRRAGEREAALHESF